MVPGKFNMVCPQGSSFNQELVYSIDDVPVDVTGYYAAMMVREKYTSKTPVVSIDSVLGGIDLGTSDGVISINIDHAITETLHSKEYVYDLEVTDPYGKKTRLIEGKFIVTPEVTRG
jgi:hypothetical protein